jgi:hypothetical protein
MTTIHDRLMATFASTISELDCLHHHLQQIAPQDPDLITIHRMRSQLTRYRAHWRVECAPLAPR